METFVSNSKMKFSNYLEELLGSRVKVKILRALFRFETKTFTSRELAEQIRVSHTAVLKSIGDLQGMNVIRIESHGKSNLINLNRESRLYADLRQFFGLETDTIQRLKEDLRRTLPKAKSIAIFGSVAAKKEKLNSDIDVLILSDNVSKVNEVIAGKQQEFSRKYGNVIAAYVMSPSEFKRKRNSEFVKGILENHILVKGEGL